MFLPPYSYFSLFFCGAFAASPLFPPFSKTATKVHRASGTNTDVSAADAAAAAGRFLHIHIHSAGSGLSLKRRF